MAKPNYDRWDLINEFSLDHAAALCCDTQPEPWDWRTNPTPPIVTAMADAIERECPANRPKETVLDRYDALRSDPPPPGKRKWHRTALRAWAEREPRRLAAMPFLMTPEERAIPTPQPGPASVLRADAERRHKILTGLLVLAVTETGGTDYLMKNGKPNLSAVVRKLATIAEDEDVDLSGLANMDERLSAGLKELKKNPRT